jgi:hypothetical protein
MPGITNGAELVRKLAESGTINDKLECARNALRAAKMEHGRVATSAEVVAALHDRYGPTHMTVVKAKALAETGVWTGPVQPEDVPIEEQLLAAETKPAPAKGK